MSNFCQEYRPATLSEVSGLLKDIDKQFANFEPRQKPHAPDGLTNSTSPEVCSYLETVLGGEQS